MFVTHIVGARPNFVKAAPVHRSLASQVGVRQLIIHTGQHYDANMSDVFFRQLAIPEPDVNLQVGSGSHAQQSGLIMSRLEPVLLEHRPDLVLVYGDVNSTVAAALVCAKLGIRVGHIEAGLRSFDRSMPEEINRVLTDQLSDLLFTPSADGNENLVREGVSQNRIHLVGNVMIDTLVAMLPIAKQVKFPDLPLRYALVTLHRPSNVGDVNWLAKMLNTLSNIGQRIQIVFPVHPRTRSALFEADPAIAKSRHITLFEPMPYLEFLALQARATVVITDSGGIQEETTYLGVPCLTVRENTERPVTLTCGTNILVGRDPQRIEREISNVLAGNWTNGRKPALWDGHAADRIASIVTALA
jgi:UDP-N-acetylglucosamine 2-epimerase (non-hydrolysing)